MDQDTSPDRRAFVAPLISTLLTVVTAAITFLFVGFSPMACDSCNGEVAHRFDESFQTAFTVYQAGLLVTLGLLVAGWALPWQRRMAARRVGIALAAPAALVLDVVVFYALVDWP
jgi:cell division protein FtsX